MNSFAWLRKQTGLTYFGYWMFYCSGKQSGKASRRNQNGRRRAYRKYMLSLGQRGV